MLRRMGWRREESEESQVRWESRNMKFIDEVNEAQANTYIMKWNN